MSVMHFLFSSLDKREMYEENVKRRGGGITEEKKNCVSSLTNLPFFQAAVRTFTSSSARRAATDVHPGYGQIRGTMNKFQVNKRMKCFCLPILQQ